MMYAAIDTFYLTDEQLRDSPSRKDGIDEATEIALHVYGCDLIQESGILLKLYSLRSMSDLVMYTIALIPFTIYVFIVLKANDNGEGGIFALYSLICRYAKVSLLPNQQRVDGDISSFRLKLPSPELERSLCVKNCLEKNPLFKNVLLFLVLMGTSMVIGDGILTPSMSVMSAVSGLQGQVPGFDTDAVVIVSIPVLLLLFSVQRFGTGKVGFMFAPILALWFLNLGSIEIYNIIKYDISVVKAFNPVYIYLFFKMNGIKAWSALGGCILCITGSFVVRIKT